MQSNSYIKTTTTATSILGLMGRKPPLDELIELVKKFEKADRNETIDKEKIAEIKKLYKLLNCIDQPKFEKFIDLQITQYTTKTMNKRKAETQNYYNEINFDDVNKSKSKLLCFICLVLAYACLNKSNENFVYIPLTAFLLRLAYQFYQSTDIQQKAPEVNPLEYYVCQLLPEECPYVLIKQETYGEPSRPNEDDQKYPLHFASANGPTF